MPHTMNAIWMEIRTGRSKAFYSLSGKPLTNHCRAFSTDFCTSHFNWYILQLWDFQIDFFIVELHSVSDQMETRPDIGFDSFHFIRTNENIPLSLASPLLMWPFSSAWNAIICYYMSTDSHCSSDDINKSDKSAHHTSAFKSIEYFCVVLFSLLYRTQCPMCNLLSFYVATHLPGSHDFFLTITTISCDLGQFHRQVVVVDEQRNRKKTRPCHKSQGVHFPWKYFFFFVKLAFISPRLVPLRNMFWFGLFFSTSEIYFCLPDRYG